VAQLELLFKTNTPAPSHEPGQNWLEVGSRRVRLAFVRHPRARRYVLRVLADGSARVTLPRRGSFSGARQFVLQNIPWLERRLQQAARRAASPSTWVHGTKILFRGEDVVLQRVETNGSRAIQFAQESIPASTENLRPQVEGHLRRLASRELPHRLLELAAHHGFVVQRITIRNQRSRWGSCSRSGTISLNWRLIQAPPFVSDYILLHELAHLKHMNHSARYWAEVARICPAWDAAEKWLKQYSRRLL
jgi:predicted metal-dependent hydrolase